MDGTFIIGVNAAEDPGERLIRKRLHVDAYPQTAAAGPFDGEVAQIFC